MDPKRRGRAVVPHHALERDNRIFEKKPSGGVRRGHVVGAALPDRGFRGPHCEIHSQQIEVVAALQAVDLKETGPQYFRGVEEVCQALQHLRRKSGDLLREGPQNCKVSGPRDGEPDVVVDRDVRDRVLSLELQEEVLALAEVSAHRSGLFADGSQDGVDGRI